MSVRDDPKLPDRVVNAIRAGVRGLAATQTTRLAPALDDAERSLAEIRVLRELIFQAENELVARGQKAHEKKATWAEIAESSGHRTASAARRYFIADPIQRRARESRDRS